MGECIFFLIINLFIFIFQFQWLYLVYDDTKVFVNVSIQFRRMHELYINPLNWNKQQAYGHHMQSRSLTYRVKYKVLSMFLSLYVKRMGMYIYSYRFIVIKFLSTNMSKNNTQHLGAHLYIFIYIHSQGYQIP